jgi:hypothetical protein
MQPNKLYAFPEGSGMEARQLNISFPEAHAADGVLID